MKKVLVKKILVNKKDKRSGVALLLTVLICLAMIPMVGLAVDGTNSYILRSQISTALDAAVLAGARSLSAGNDLPTQEKNAIVFEQSVFAANVANLSSNIKWTFTANPIIEGTDHYRTVGAAATAVLPLSMLSLVGISTANVSLTASAKRRDINLIVVLDHSFPLTSSGAYSTLRNDLVGFVEMFANNRDNVGLITVSGSDYLAYPPDTQFLSSANNIPAQLSADDGVVQPYDFFAASNLAAGLSDAYTQLQSLPAGALNVIVIFTGGLPQSFTGNFSALIDPSAHCGVVGNPLNAVLWAFPYTDGVAGLADPGALSINDRLETRAAPEAGTCSLLAPGVPINTYTYITQFPTADIYGNSTGFGSGTAFNADVNFGLVNADTVSAAAQNALDDAANTIRSSALAPVIYTLTLSGLPFTKPNSALMSRVANDPALSGNYNSNQPSGMYLSTPSPDQLASLFKQVASQVLGLTK